MWYGRSGEREREGEAWMKLEISSKKAGRTEF
jgi:hypothetical protein